MKNHFTVALLITSSAAMLCLGNACRTTDDSPSQAVAVEPIKSQIPEHVKKQKADQILDRIIKGMNEDDYDSYAADFTVELKERVNRKNFKKMNAAMEKDIGKYRSREFMGQLDKKILDVFMWKARFSKSEEDLIIRLVLGEVDSQYKVFSISISNL